MGPGRDGDQVDEILVRVDGAAIPPRSRGMKKLSAVYYEGQRDTRRQVSQLLRLRCHARLPDPDSAGTSTNPPDISGRVS
jgi:hypothetical protein